MPLRDLYPECYVLIHGEDQLYPMACMEKVCHKNRNCMTTLAHRVNFVFDKIAPQAKMLVAYYKYADREKSIRGVIFTKGNEPILDFSEGIRFGTDLKEDLKYETPFLSTLNPYAFRRFMRKGRKFQWTNTGEFYRLGSSDVAIIPVASLLRDDSGSDR